MDERDWSRLVLLSVLWGGTFFFTGVALKELPPLTLVFLRLSIAALILLPPLWVNGVRFPAGITGWRPFAVMALINNVIPFSLLVMAQTYIPSGMASVLNATTPVFTVLVAAAFGEERLIFRRVAGVLLGLCGVIILKGYDFDISSNQSIGIALCLGATISFGFSALWATRKLAGTPPIGTATFQLISAMAGHTRYCVTLHRAGVYSFLSDRHALRREQRDAGDASCSRQRDSARLFLPGREDRSS